MATAGLKLTQKTVEAAVCPPGKKDILLFDRETRGFGLRVTAAGGKSFVAQYQAPGGKRRVALGAFGVLTVEQARQAAKGILGAAAAGSDPVADRKIKAAADARARAEAEFTVRKLIEGWVAGREGDRRRSYLSVARTHLIRNLPDWLDRGAADVTLAEAVRLLDHLKATKGVVTANRTLAYARAAYSWAVQRQHLPANPLKGIARPGREVSRERVLAGAELAAIFAACEGLGASLGGCVRIMMLTLQRRDEVASMRWAELDSMQAPTTWTLPRERTKNGRAHVVHLSEPVRAILRGMPKVKGHPFVFAGHGSLAAKDAIAKPISAFSYAKREIVAELTKAGHELPPWTFHDFRRAGVTALADAGFAPHVCDRLLNHITGSIQGVAAVYQRAEFLAERKAALDTWARFVMSGGNVAASDNVVPLARAG